MKPTIKKQSILKGLLLMALAANISWDQHWADLQETDLLQVSGDSETRSSKPNETATSETIYAPAPARKPNPNAARPGNSGPNARRDAELAAHRDSEELELEPAQPETAVRAKPVNATVCGVGIRLEFKEKKDRNGDAYVHINVLPRIKQEGEKTMKAFDFTARGTLKENLGTTDDVETITQKAKTEAKKRLKGIANCGSNELVAANTSSTSSSTRSIREDEESDEEGFSELRGGGTSRLTSRDRSERRLTRAEAKRLKEAKAKCRVDEDGVKLSATERSRCQLRLIGEIDYKYGNERSGKRAAERKLKSIVNGQLKASVKSKLMSKDPSKVEEGEEMLDDMIAQVSDLANELDLDPRKSERMIHQLEGMKAGSEVYRKSREFQEESRELRTELQQAYMQYQQTRDPMIGMQIQGLLQQYNELQSQMSSELTYGPYQELLQHRAYMSASEFNQWSQPYDLLRRDMLSMLNGGNGASQFGSQFGGPFSAPGNLMQYRSSLSPMRSYGLTLPGQAPSWNLGTMGLSNGSFQTGFGAQRPTGFGPTNFGGQPSALGFGAPGSFQNNWGAGWNQQNTGFGLNTGSNWNTNGSWNTGAGFGTSNTFGAPSSFNNGTSWNNNSATFGTTNSLNGGFGRTGTTFGFGSPGQNSFMTNGTTGRGASQIGNIPPAPGAATRGL